MAELILASTSAGRAAMLRAAGLAFRQEPSQVDERAIEAGAAQAEGGLDAGKLALTLAAAKAEAVSARAPEALVIGADSVMECGGVAHHKPVDMEAAREQLLALRGRTHRLLSAACVAVAGRAVWRHVSEARLTMRDFSEDFLDVYLGMESEAVLLSVGGYRIEGPGIQLFADVNGDHFTIIGLPLLPLLGYLRGRGALME